MISHRHVPFIVFMFLSFSLAAQDKVPVKFGKVSANDFSTKIYSVDSNAAAVIIADVGSSQIVGNSKGWFSLEFKHYRRVHILNKNGFDLATWAVSLYAEGDNEEKLSGLKGVAYNLVDGKVVETKLSKDNIFKTKEDSRWTETKFTFPNVKEGTIIEFEYTIASDYLRNLRSWTFQGGYPRLWSEYNLKLPSFFSYVFLKQGYRKFDIETRTDDRELFSVTDTRGTGSASNYSFTSGTSNYKWVVKDVNALKEESFVSTLENHIQKITFELTEQRDPLTPHVFLNTWEQTSKELMNDEQFGLQLTRDNGWLGDDIRAIVGDSKTSLEKARKVYAYVRDNFTCTNRWGFWTRQTLKNVLKNKKGTVSEINLLLTSMLRYIDVSAYPLILSTRSHGYTYAPFPILARFNYVICTAKIDGRNVYLDATRPMMGFGKLPIECYNGHARVINEEATSVDLLADSLLERKVTTVMLSPNKDGVLEGTVDQIQGYYESVETRGSIKEKGEEIIFANIKKTFPAETELMKTKIDSVDALEENLRLKYDFKLNNNNENILYINPMFIEGFKENPFKSAERFYPVEMPYAIDETYVLSMVVPDGYVVDELPKAVRVKLNEEGDGEFEYLLSESRGMISLRSRIKLKKAYYYPDDYEMLREFFNLVVKKHNEQIVLKRKS